MELLIKIKALDFDSIGIYADYLQKDKCKSIPSAKWDGKAKCWKYSKSSILDILDTFDDLTLDKTLKAMRDDELTKRELLENLRNKIIKPRSHEFLMYHQRICRDIATQYDRFAYFLDTGTGKTITSLQIMKDKGTKFLVICPKSIIKTAWVDDQRGFFPSLRMLPLSRNMSKEDYQELIDAWGLKPSRTDVRTKDKMKSYLSNHAQVYVINPESFKSDINEIKKLGVSGIVLDESTMIKNPTSQVTKQISSFAYSLDYMYILSGKPAPNGIMDYFSQMRVIDEGVLGTSFFSFRNRYFMPTGYQGYDWQPKPETETEIARRLSARSIFIKKEDCLDLPEKTYLVRDVELPTKAKQHYLEMEKAQVLMLDEKMISVPSKLASMMKLRQITSGFILDTAESSTEPLHTAKLKELENVLDDIDKQVIIWINFKAEVAMIADMLTKKGKTFVTAYSGTKNVDDSIKAFKNGEVQYIIAHPQTLKYGVTFTNCTYAIYYSLSYSYEDYYQSHDRIYRKGQTKPCTFIFLLAEGTIDKDIYIVLKNKGKVADIIENMVRRRS